MIEDKNTNQTLSHLFRQESGKMVSVLVNIFGTENLELAEDVVQDSLVSALETWKYRGVPDNPKAWLYRTAKNKALDIIRRRKHSLSIDFSDPERQLLTSEYTAVGTMNDFWKESHIKDDFLGMMFACCHPEISQENQISFILKSLCGFSTKEVARAFLCSEDTVSKRLYRTKEFFRKSKIRPEIPHENDIQGRTNSVLSAIYLMFNEGYNSTHSDQLIRKDIISQAMLLCRSLLENEKTRLPEVYALMALMCFHSARINSRLTSTGNLILLAKQDRSKWDTKLIETGNRYMNQAAFGNSIGHYHLEAAIAYEHCSARTYESTSWKTILRYYDTLLTIAYDPIVILNRCLVILEIDGPSAALNALNEIRENAQIQKYYLFHASLGTIYERLNKNKQARESFKEALKLTQSKQEQQFLQERINESRND